MRETAIIYPACDKVDQMSCDCKIPTLLCSLDNVPQAGSSANIYNYIG